MGKQRSIWADSLKGWLMILVVLGHAIQNVVAEYDTNHLWNIIYSFHMPAFMAVSGWFAYRTPRHLPGNQYVIEGVKETLRRRVDQLLVPFFCMSLLSFILRGDYTFMELSNIILYPDKYFWFLWVLFWINAIFIFDKWIAMKSNVNELIPIGVSCLVLLVAMVGMEIRMFGFQFLAYYFLFYALGYCIRRFGFLQVRGRLSLFLLSGVWLIMAWSWNMHKLPGWMPEMPYVPTTLLQYAYRGLTAVLAILLIFGASPSVLDTSGRLNLFISKIGIVSLGVYVWHLLFMGYIVSFLLDALPHVSGILLIVFATVFSLASTMLIVEILKRNKITARLFLGKAS